MALDKNAELLGGVSLFNGLAPDQLSAIISRSKKAFFEAGSMLIKRETKGEKAYLILSGKARTCPPQEIKLDAEMLEAGTLVGEMVILTKTSYSLDVVAEERVRALSVSREDLYALMEEDPSIAHRLAGKVTERLMYLAQDLRMVDSRFAALEASLNDIMLKAS